MTSSHRNEAVFPVRVYYEDTDAGGVVYYANYLKFMERARTEWLREMGVDQSAMAVRERRLFVVKDLAMSYLKPARLDDLLTIRSRITRLGRASLHFAQRAERGEELLASGNIQVCCVDADTLRPSPIPRALHAKLNAIFRE